MANPQSPQMSPSFIKKSPQLIAQKVADYTKSLVILFFWFIVLCASIMATMLSVKIIYFGYRLALEALGEIR